MGGNCLPQGVIMSPKLTRNDCCPPFTCNQTNAPPPLHNNTPRHISHGTLHHGLVALNLTHSHGNLSSLPTLTPPIPTSTATMTPVSLFFPLPPSSTPLGLTLHEILIRRMILLSRWQKVIIIPSRIRNTQSSPTTDLGSCPARRDLDNHGQTRIDDRIWHFR